MERVTTTKMSVRSETMYNQPSRSTESELKFDDLTETEKSAATIGVNPEAWKPISWMNAGHYTELLKKNALGCRLTQQIEAFKVVSSS